LQVWVKVIGQSRTRIITIVLSILQDQLNTSMRLKKAPTSLKLNNIKPDLILAFLDHLEHEQHNAVLAEIFDSLRAAGVSEIRRPTRRRLITCGRTRTGRANEALRAPNAGIPHARRNGCGLGTTR
jgi:hypothetical protein